MKKFLLSVLAATTLFAACTTESTTDVVSVPVPDVLTVSLEEDTRMQLMDEKTVWNEGDLVSVFYKSNANQKWKFNGVTGDRIGELSQVEPGVASAPMEKVVVVYPYNANYLITPSTGAVETTLPAEQSYLENSYGIGSSMLIASGYYTQFTFKNVMGWLKLQLTGEGEKVTKVVFRGNDGEQVAGNVYVNADDASLVLSSAEADEGEEGSVNGNLNFENSVVTELTLNCDEVTLGAEATSFYLALPPQVFEKGFTVDIWALDAEENELKMTAKSEGLLAIERNAIQPLEAIAYQGKPTTIYAQFNAAEGMDLSMMGINGWYVMLSDTKDYSANGALLLVVPSEGVDYEGYLPTSFYAPLNGTFDQFNGGISFAGDYVSAPVPCVVCDPSMSSINIWQDDETYTTYFLKGTDVAPDMDSLQYGVMVETAMPEENFNFFNLYLPVVDAEGNEYTLVAQLDACEITGYPIGGGAASIPFNLTDFGFTEFELSYDENSKTIVYLTSSSNNGLFKFELDTASAEGDICYSKGFEAGVNMYGGWTTYLEATEENFDFVQGRVLFEKVEGSENKYTMSVLRTLDGGSELVMSNGKLSYAISNPEETGYYELTINFPEPEVIGIDTAADLVAFAAAVDAGDYSAWVDPADGEVNVLAELDMTGVAWTPISSFNGVFDGGNFAIKNWNTSRGLFAVNTGTVKNVVIDATCALSASATVVDEWDIAFVVEHNSSTGIVDHCANNGSVTIASYEINGEETDANRTQGPANLTVGRIGSVVGSSYGKVLSCTNSGAITVNGSVQLAKTQCVGGVVGYINTNMSGYEALGAEFLVSCENTGNVTVDFEGYPQNLSLGGVLGGTKATKLLTTEPTHQGTIKGCVNRGTVSYTFDVVGVGTYANIGGIVGYSEANVVSSENHGLISYKISTAQTSNPATRPGVGGIVGTNLYSVTNCTNYGNIDVEGMWGAGGTTLGTRAGNIRFACFGGVVGDVGTTEVDTNYAVSGCYNRGEVKVTNYCQDSGTVEGHIGGVVGYATIPVTDCHNYAKLDFKSRTGHIYMGGVLAYSLSSAVNLTNNSDEVEFRVLGITKKKPQHIGGVIGKSDSVDNCRNYGNVNVVIEDGIVNPSQVTYIAGVVGYATLSVSNSVLDADVTLTMNKDLQTETRFAGVVGQIGTVKDQTLETLTNCSTTADSHVTFNAVNTHDSYIGGVIALCNNGLSGCVNNATVTLNVPTANAGTKICYVAGVAGRQKQNMIGCANNGAVVANMGGSTCPLYIAGVLADNFAAASTVSGSTNSANVTVTNYSGTGIYSGVVAHSADGATVATDCTSTGTVTVNGTAQ